MAYRTVSLPTRFSMGQTNFSTREAVCNSLVVSPFWICDVGKYHSAGLQCRQAPNPNLLDVFPRYIDSHAWRPIIQRLRSTQSALCHIETSFHPECRNPFATGNIKITNTTLYISDEHNASSLCVVKLPLVLVISFELIGSRLQAQPWARRTSFLLPLVYTLVFFFQSSSYFLTLQVPLISFGCHSNVTRK